MSGLRSHFHSARTGYRHVRYPGDLSVEVLGPIAPSRWYKWPARLGFGGLGLAAVIAWVVLLSRPPRHRDHSPRMDHEHQDTVAVVPDEAPEAALSPPGMPQMPEMPDWSAMPAMPAMPAELDGVAPPNAPSFFPDMIPLEPPGFPPATAPDVSHTASTKEPA